MEWSTVLIPEVRNNSWLVNRLRLTTPSFLLYSNKAGGESHDTLPLSSNTLSPRWMWSFILSGCTIYVAGNHVQILQFRRSLSHLGLLLYPLLV